MRIEGETVKAFYVVRLDSFETVNKGELVMADDATGEVAYNDRGGRVEKALPWIARDLDGEEMTRQINDAGLAIIKTDEGLELNAYRDPRGIPTIGYGHTPAKMGETITEAEATTLLTADVEWACAAVDAATTDVFTTENQFSAMVSLTFNIGVGAFRGSSVLRLHRNGDQADAANAFLLWDKEHIDGNLVVSTGLIRRREQERDLYLEGLTT